MEFYGVGSNPWDHEKNAGMNIRNYHLFWWLMSRKIWALDPGHQISDRIPPIFSWPWSYPYTPTFIGWNSHHIGAKSQKTWFQSCFSYFSLDGKGGKLWQILQEISKDPHVFLIKSLGKLPLPRRNASLCPLQWAKLTSWSEAWPGRCPKICGDIDRKYHI